MKKTVLFVTASLGYGGAAKILSFVASSLSEIGYKVHIANIMSTDTRVLQTLPENIEIHDASSNKGKGFRRLDQALKVKKIAQETDADVIVGFTLFPNVIASIVAKSLKIKSIVSERGDPYRTIGKDVVSKMMLSIVNNADGGVFQTDGAMGFYSKKMQEKGHVIPNPIFLPSYGIPERYTNSVEKTVVSVGRLENFQKRYDVMLKAFAIFSDTHPEYTLRLIGDGPDESKIREWCRELNIEEKVIFLGKSSQPMKDIVNDGMFIITSDYEGISNALLEAMALGLPCVSTDHSPGGGRFLISHGENGLLAPVGDAKMLAKKMEKFADDSEFAMHCGNNAKLVIERFAPSKIIKEWDMYITEVCSR